jgi:predicted peptidase
MKKIIAICFMVAFGFSAFAQDFSLFEKKEFVEGTDTLRYRILYPVNYKARRKYPLVLFLHGAGERGNDNQAQLTWGASLFLDPANREEHPAIVIFPQCPEDSSWSAHVRNKPEPGDSLGGFSFPANPNPTEPMMLVMALIHSMVDQHKVKTKQIYVGGLSMGGFGTFDILWRMPDFFAAAFPICGGGNPDNVPLYAKNTALWVFHGGNDPVVPPANSRRMVNALEAAKAQVRFTIYPGVGHDSWKNAFAEPDLLSWLYSHEL